MKTLEMTMKVVEDRSAPMMFTEKNLPGACCCTCCCCFTFNSGSGTTTGASTTLSSPLDKLVL